MIRSLRLPGAMREDHAKSGLIPWPERPLSHAFALLAGLVAVDAPALPRASPALARANTRNGSPLDAHRNMSPEVFEQQLAPG